MGGVTKKVKQELGGSKGPTASQTINRIVETEASKAARSTSVAAAEDQAARRRARRGARALLSESRLNPEQGVTTLGQTGL